MHVPPLYAHRLGRAYGPDSSWPALARSLAGGVLGLETDVCLTADGRLALLHEPYLPLGTTLDGWAHERTADEIAAGRILDGAGRATGHCPLLLDDLLDAVPAKTTLQLEVKSHADAGLARRTAEAVCARLRRAPRSGPVEVLSFHTAACEAAAAGGLPARLVVWAEHAPIALVRWARRRGVGGICVEHFLLSHALVGVLRRAGLSVTTGTVNDPALLRRVAGFGPDAVTTDRPLELAEEAAALAEAA
jgi:glycerophosphoryl diester phosphodiesterase